MSDISVVIPTCDRRERVLSLLGDLSRSTHRPLEVLVVDSSDRPLGPDDVAPFGASVRTLESPKSVCVQRNRGVREARGAWIFLCDDDVEVPPDYLDKLCAHLAAHPEAGAVSGLFLERSAERWVAQYPVTSRAWLLWARLFHLGLWGEIHCRGLLGDLLTEHYRRRGNHISSAGWPVLTDFQAPFFRTPVYSLGAALVRREWLLRSPFDEALERHGYGDNYGAALGFPSEGIHVVTEAFVHHHKAAADRPAATFAYANRILAIDRFIDARPELEGVRRGWLLWSLLGNAIYYAGTRRLDLSWSSLKTLSIVLAGRNPYRAARA
ncbi:MAG TPA: glycosyltransferase [Polyangia bacterium]|nr:glycosyltransferase [Polyangia bacterium]